MCFVPYCYDRPPKRIVFFFFSTGFFNKSELDSSIFPNPATQERCKPLIIVYYDYNSLDIFRGKYSLRKCCLNPILGGSNIQDKQDQPVRNIFGRT